MEVVSQAVPSCVVELFRWMRLETEAVEEIGGPAVVLVVDQEIEVSNRPQRRLRKDGRGQLDLFQGKNADIGSSKLARDVADEGEESFRSNSAGSLKDVKVVANGTWNAGDGWGNSAASRR